jgi:phosphatidylglycerophosphatase A
MSPPTPPQHPTDPAAGSPPRASLAVWLAVGLGAGWAPKAPGTWGTLLGLPLAWAIHQTGLFWQIAAIVALALLGAPICTIAARRLGGQKDPGAIVLDEIASLPIVFLGVDLVGFSGRTLVMLLVGFGLHRLFDITKPPPVRHLERLPDGWGVMADDTAAAAYACLTLHALLWLVQLSRT